MVPIWPLRIKATWTSERGTKKAGVLLSLHKAQLMVEVLHPFPVLWSTFAFPSPWLCIKEFPLLVTTTMTGQHRGPVPVPMFLGWELHCTQIFVHQTRPERIEASNAFGKVDQGLSETERKVVGLGLSRRLVEK